MSRTVSDKQETPMEEEVPVQEVTSQETIDEILGEATADVVEVSAEEKLQQELGAMEDKFLRAQAEIANMRNRFNKEREDAAKYRAQDLAKDLLPALDNLDRALAIEVTDVQGENLKKGIEMVKESVLSAFKAAHIEEIPALGEAFDPNLHQAVQTLPLEEGQKEDEIVQVLQTGYVLYGRVLRPTMVIVAQA